MTLPSMFAAIVLSAPLQTTTVADLILLIPPTVEFAERDARKHAHDRADGPLLVNLRSVQLALAFPASELIPDSVAKRVLNRPFRDVTHVEAVIEERPGVYRVLEHGVLVEVNAVILSPVGGLAYVYVTSTTECRGVGTCPRQWRLTFRAGGDTKWILLKHESLFVS